MIFAAKLWAGRQRAGGWTAGGQAGERRRVRHESSFRFLAGEYLKLAAAKLSQTLSRTCRKPEPVISGDILDGALRL